MNERSEVEALAEELTLIAGRLQSLAAEDREDKYAFLTYLWEMIIAEMAEIMGASKTPEQPSESSRKAR